MAKSTRSRQGSTSQCYGKPGQISSTRSGGAQHTRESQGTRRPTNGPSSRRRSQTPVGSNGLVTRTDWGHARCRSSDPSRTSSGRSRIIGCRRSYRCSYPRPPSWHPRRRIRGGRATISFVFPSLRTLFLCDSLGAYHIFLGQAWAEGNGELATCRHRADSGWETWIEVR